jgi:hypothetical protein
VKRFQHTVTATLGLYCDKHLCRSCQYLLVGPFCLLFTKELSQTKVFRYARRLPECKAAEAKKP